MKKCFRNILLIDDDEINNFIIKDFIKELNSVVSCHSINDVEEAITYLRNCTITHFPDFIFVDLLMPQYDGFDFLEAYEAEFYKKYPQTKLFMLTASLRESDSIRAASFACLTEFITKDNVHKILTIIFEKYYDDV